VQGQVGDVELGQSDIDDDEPTLENDIDVGGVDGGDVDGGGVVGGDAVRGGGGAAPAIDRVIDLYPRPERLIHCLDLKVTDQADAYVAEIRRVIGQPASDQANEPVSLPVIGGKIVQVDETTSRRWYPVIDFSRCTNCMECVDFCLFGVYGVDGVENILVEQPDNCRKGCPACSRVCPENAIIFPQHKAPAIAGAQVDGDEGFKIDLSQLFGAPAGSDDPIATAARERDEQLLLTGRDAVGIDDQLKRRQENLAAKPKDDLDVLLDSLDEFDL
jgi:NAD-dependent dihydropyrimidine dehydrogenase PreA subunit